MRNSQLILMLFILFTFSIGYSQTNEFSKEEVLKDLDTLKALLEKSHYNLYAYTPKKSLT
jgi:hypothetical protein